MQSKVGQKRTPNAGCVFRRRHNKRTGIRGEGEMVDTAQMGIWIQSQSISLRVDSLRSCGQSKGPVASHGHKTNPGTDA